jgi:hypothetical protein
VNFSGQIDTTMDMSVQADCFPNGKVSGGLPGLVSSAVLFLNGNMGDTVFPTFYVDDLSVTVTDGHNLVGNPNFEATGAHTDGWSTGGQGSGTLTVSTTQHNGTSGKGSLVLQGRTTSTVAIRYAMPIGPADYAVTFYVMQMGTTSHAIQLSVDYFCSGDNTAPGNLPRSKVVATTAPLPPGMWVALSTSAVAFPPSDAPKGCKLLGAGTAFWVTQADGGPACGTGTSQVECPDIYLDDASITLTNTAPTD